MRIIISPAKKMKIDTDSPLDVSTPKFMEQTEVLLEYLRGMCYEEAKGVWKCNDSIANLNYERIQRMDLYTNLTPAVLSYEGIQYQYMGPGVFKRSEFEYIEEHLRILSGFYGMLKPFDGVTPYRLEMQAKLQIGEFDSLYDFWGKRLAEEIFSQSDCIINLASKEYSRCISEYIDDGIKFISCVFGEMKGEKVIEKGTQVKMARGEMIRFMAENKIKNAEKIKLFDRLGYIYDDNLSDDYTYVFIKGGK
ncbi:peroxide stress protein YaaA [Sedimentibacter hydroxybenzoicus DSM 7310]|uniref:UPF0246 protein HZF24_14215 n=1 Tax=Sedimentibacter hydroxybenzoicus DSM 7310 TaxID=1123245 RepID=A0A974BLR7_SEDHY|nr:peroxide stress protein YaaA [Sedimentibacter hydroxybenzoicus]NYB75298.1 peroxide stress protein YaaA [Sedimentibacter hydroxybenzoicus DSM 7310]